MARRGRGHGYTQNAAHNTDNLPPPSTIAAQIVHNRSNVARQEPENEALFGKLLQEYLRDPVIEEANVETNAQLISVVAEAGLDVLVKDNPFAPDNLLRQAEDSLSVLQFTIERKPEVLLFRGIGSPGDDLPLFLWLLPKILTLLAQRQMEAIHSKLCEVLSTCTRSLRRSSQFWRFATIVQDILRSVVEDVLSNLENRFVESQKTSPRVDISVPSSESMIPLWPNARHVLAVPQGYQAHLHHVDQAQQLALNLLLAISVLGMEGDNMISSVATSAAIRTWAVDCCRRILNCCKSFHVTPSLESDHVMSSICHVAFVASPIQNSTCDARPLLDLLVELIWAFKRYKGLKLKETIESQLRDLLGSDQNTVIQDQSKRRLLPLVKACRADGTGENRVDFQELLDTIDQFFQRIEQSSNNEEARPSKRQRIGELQPKDPLEIIYEGQVRRVTSFLADQPRSNVDGLSETAIEHFNLLTEEEKCEALTELGMISCSAFRCLDERPAKEKLPNCSICDFRNGLPPSENSKTWDGMISDDFKEIFKVLSLILGSTELRRSRKPRVLAAHAIRRIINHTKHRSQLMLGANPLGSWLMRSLQSSLRELRVASAQALMSFLREDILEEIRTKNRLEALDFLRCLTDKNNISEQETLVITWSLVGRNCGHDELNLALIQLIDFLGHTHPVICGVAYHEILKLAEDLNRNPLELFKPFWSSVAMHVVKDLITRPQKAQQLSDLLGISVNDFLLLTQTETVPYLVLTRRRDVLQRIAQARGPVAGIQDLWLQPSKNLAAVVSLLLVQQSQDPEVAAISLLKDAAPDFRESDLSNMVKVDPILIACEILKHAGDCQDAKRLQAHQGVRLLAIAAERKPGQSKTKLGKALSSFLETHVLGIMSHFTDVIDSSVDRQPLAEKKRSLRAIEQLIILANKQTGIALPQIRATLQSAFQVEQLVDCAFSAWVALVSATGEDDIESLIDHTFAIIVQNWASFSWPSQLRAQETIANLLKNHNTLIRDRIEMIPSLANIPLLDKFEGEINRFKSVLDPTVFFEAFSRRCNDETSAIVHQALIELVPFLHTHQRIIHESAVSQQPHPLITKLSRALLDASIKFKETHRELVNLCGQCLGIIGSIDPNRVDSTRTKQEILMLSNFEKADEVINFVAYMLEKIIVEAFHAASTGRTQTYLAYVMQELLRFCGFRQAVTQRSKSSQITGTYQRWVQIPEAVQSTLTPYFNTKYVIVHPVMPADGNDFPIFNSEIKHGTWLRKFVFSLLHKAKGENAQMVFPVLSRVIWGHDITIPTFLLPFVVLNVVVGGNDSESGDILTEFLEVLSYDVPDTDDIKQCSENIFQVVDYLSKWLQEKKKVLNEAMSSNARSHAAHADLDEIREVAQISSVEKLLFGIPAAAISRRAVQCHSYARAAFHWELYIRSLSENAKLKKEPTDFEEEFKHLQHIYAQIDEPDAVEGMSTRLQILDPEQQVLEYKRAGRWTAAQSWYEIELAEKPNDQALHVELFNCLKSSGRYGPLLDTIQSVCASQDISFIEAALPFAAEASWVTSKWDMLDRFVNSELGSESTDFNAGIGRAFLALRKGENEDFRRIISTLRENVMRGLSVSSTASLAAAHPYTIKLHALYELEQVSGLGTPNFERDTLLECLDRRLDIVGAFTDDKQYLLGIRRAAMGMSKLEFQNQQLSAAWLTSARLNRKAGLIDAAYDAVLRATQLHDGAAKIEHSRLLWGDGYHRKAIQNLEGAIETNVFQSYTISTIEDTIGTTTDEQQKHQNFLVAKTQLLLAKWMDSAGQIKSEELRNYYLQACNSFRKWEKGHYYMGKHYLKIFESEKAAPRAKQTQAYLSGDCQKLVVENFLRSMVFGTKYYYQTIPKVLTLWLDLGAELHAAEKQPRSLDPTYHGLKVKKLDTVNKQVKKYMERLPAFVFYTALPQIMSRINHPHPKVAEVVLEIIIRIATIHPQQSLWSILAVAKAKANDKATRATLVLNKLKQAKQPPLDLKALISHGVKITQALLAACEIGVDARISHASLQKDLGFKPSLAPCLLVVPVEKTMQASLPLGIGGLAIRSHKPFPRNAVTIASFQDDVLVLSSLQRPRKLTIRGSDGELYGLLCKPKDDLRKDQRLMEFTSMIDRALKRDVESSKRRLYIRTYAVTPLNEECGAIEWVDGLKPMRDIILASLKAKGVRPDYNDIRQLLDKACADLEHGSAKIFTDQVQTKFPPVLYEWFLEVFPEPESWFAARLRYTRSCAVMSIVGHVLGLGDRHGENILLQSGNGGCFHVDFNCLFDKGLTFEKPELVPFRLTSNMVDAMGVYGYEGPFRTSAELTLKILRQYEDTLMTIMETFLHDPTTDFIAKPKKRTGGVPETPGEVLESVRGKVGGWLPGETVPLSVDGYVDALIKMAVDPGRLASMYIGWCAFF